MHTHAHTHALTCTHTLLLAKEELCAYVRQDTCTQTLHTHTLILAEEELCAHARRDTCTHTCTHVHTHTLILAEEELCAHARRDDPAPPEPAGPPEPGIQLVALSVSV